MGHPAILRTNLQIALLRMAKLRRRIYRRGGLLGGGHGAQHLCLPEVVLRLLGILGCGAQGLALQAVRKKLGRG
jgi:hypothetical protein